MRLLPLKDKRGACGKMYQYLIVGAGLYGATLARELTDAGRRVLVLEKRQHIAGNVYTETVEGIQVHRYGAHIFHTNFPIVWEYVQRLQNSIDLPILLWQIIWVSSIRCLSTCIPLIRCGEL